MNYYKIYTTPKNFSDIILKSDGEFLTGLYFKEYFNEKLEPNLLYSKNLKIFEDTIKWLDIYFKGENPNFTPKYKIENLTPFRSLVMDYLNKIPYGKTVFYSDIAWNIAKTKGLKKMSSQAVGGAVGFNPICIIIPCHRVIGKNNNLTGYGGGIENKIELLKLEKSFTENLTLKKRK